MSQHDAEEHKKSMQEQQAIVRERVAQAKEKRGVIIYLFGKGKGKSSSAFGMVARALGHGQKVSINQFIKGNWKTGEQNFFKNFSDVTHNVMGTGFTWNTQDREKDVVAAEKIWSIAETALQDEKFNLVLLDELTYMYEYEYLPVDICLAALKNKPKNQNVVITGRCEIPELVDIADTVCEVRDIKHAFRSGVKAQRGIEW